MMTPGGTITQDVKHRAPVAIATTLQHEFCTLLPDSEHPDVGKMAYFFVGGDAVASVTSKKMSDCAQVDF